LAATASLFSFCLTSSLGSTNLDHPGPTSSSSPLSELSSSVAAGYRILDSVLCSPAATSGLLLREGILASPAAALAAAAALPALARTWH
jgi:hypothetical protein